MVAAATQLKTQENSVSTKPLSFHIPRDLHQTIRVFAAKQDIPVSEFTRIALREKLSRLQSEEEQNS